MTGIVLQILIGALLGYAAGVYKLHLHEKVIKTLFALRTAATDKKTARRVQFKSVLTRILMQVGSFALLALGLFAAGLPCALAIAGGMLVPTVVLCVGEWKKA